ncbi:MAG: V4R domain-containing protein [Candidatus Bathyarchaeales archaeon]
MEIALLPLEIGRFFFLPGRNLGGLFVVAEAERGVLQRTLSLCAKNNARLKHLILSVARSTGETKTFLIFLDMTDCDVSLEGIAEEIQNLKAVKDVKVIKQQAGGFISDTVSNMLVVGGERAIILRKTLCESFIRGIRERFGSAGEAFLYYNGLEMGMNAAKDHVEMGKKIGLIDPAQICKRMGATIFTAIGFGKMEIEKLTLNPPYALTHVYNSFECQLAPKTQIKPYSHFIRGIIAGYLTTVLNVKMKVEETECVAKGDQNCTFEAKTENQLL